MPKGKKRKPVSIDSSVCVFCNNKNVNFLEYGVKFLTSRICGDQICKVCFDTEKLVSCPKCDQPLKRTQVSALSKEEIELDKERRIRLKVMREFNLSGTDFKDAIEFKNYQELAESVIFAFLKEKESLWGEEQMEVNRKRHKDKIARNLSKLVASEREISESLKKERDDEFKFLQNAVEDKPKASLKEYEGKIPDKERKKNAISRFWQQFSVRQPRPMVKDAAKPISKVPGEISQAAGFSDEIIHLRLQSLIV